jgi:hypothetical protein
MKLSRCLVIAALTLGPLALSAEAAPRSPDASMDALVSSLSNPEFELRNAAARQLAGYGATGCDAVVEAYTAGACYPYLMGDCFEALAPDLARDLLPRYLLSTHDQVVHYAAMAVKDRELADLAPALSASLAAMGPGRGCWGPAHALRVLAPGEETARRILETGRRVGEAPEVGCFGEIDEEPYRAWLTAEERLHYLISHKLLGLEGGPETLNIELGHTEGSWEYYWDRDDEAFLIAQRKLVIDTLRPRLEAGSPLAALLLGLVRDDGAVPALRRHFLDTKEFYGWETSYPNELADGQFPRHHAFEQALTAITGVPLAEALPLSEEAHRALLQRTDPAAQYVLSRLRPAEARVIVLDQFRSRGSRLGRFHAAIIIHDHAMVPVGTPEAEVTAWLGPPDDGDGGMWRYETAGLVAPMTLILEFDEGRLVRTQLEEGNRYD